MLLSLCRPAPRGGRGDLDRRDQTRERGGEYSWSVCITVILEAPRRPRRREERRTTTRGRARAGRRTKRVRGGKRRPRSIWGSGRQRNEAAPPRTPGRKAGPRHIKFAESEKRTT